MGIGLSRREEEQREGGTAGKACPCARVTDWKYKTSVWAEVVWGREMTKDPVGGH